MPALSTSASAARMTSSSAPRISFVMVAFPSSYLMSASAVRAGSAARSTPAVSIALGYARSACRDHVTPPARILWCLFLVTWTGNRKGTIACSEESDGRAQAYGAARCGTRVIWLKLDCLNPNLQQVNAERRNCA